jgi:uncharacterized protein YbjT (DUF2867 family)
MKEQRTAILIGATGLIGSYVLQNLLAEERYQRVKVFGRKKMDVSHPKLEQHIIDFDNPQSWSALINGDDVFCCLGTTIRTAGSQEAFRKVDLEYPLSFGKAAAANGVSQYLLISSLGADDKSSNFYLRTKGEIEHLLQELKFSSFIALRPSMLLGPRKEFRAGELVGKFFMRVFFFLFLGTLKKYRAIHAATVAKAMVRLALSGSTGYRVFQSDEIQRLADEK